MRKRGRTDDNQEKIVRALRRVGAMVADLSAVGGGVPDLLVGFRMQTYLLEVKSPKGKPTPAQVSWRHRWRGRPPQTVRTVDEALAAIGAVANIKREAV
jgi:hypothetical protein